MKILLPIAICSVVLRNIFPPWSSQMTILLTTSAMYHIRHKIGEYEFKRKKNTDWLPRNINTPIDLILGKPPSIREDKPCCIPNVEWHLPWYVSKNTWAVANKIKIHSTFHTINVILSQYHQGTKVQ